MLLSSPILICLILNFSRKHICFCAVLVTHVSYFYSLSTYRNLPSLSGLWAWDRTFIYKNFCFSVFCRTTFRRIIRNESTEHFSGMPYIYGLLNCLICLWYGMPLVSPGIILVATVNSIGAVFQLIYITIFIRYAEKQMKVCTFNFLFFLVMELAT